MLLFEFLVGILERNTSYIVKNMLRSFIFYSFCGFEILHVSAYLFGHRRASYAKYRYIRVLYALYDKILQNKHIWPYLL